MDNTKEQLDLILESGKWEVDSINIPIREIEPVDNYKTFERVGVIYITR